MYAQNVERIRKTYNCTSNTAAMKGKKECNKNKKADVQS